MSDFPFEAVFVQNHLISSYRYCVSSVFPHKSASLVIILLDKEKCEVHRIYKDLVKEEYENWGADDSYLDKIVEEEVKKVVVPTLELVWEKEADIVSAEVVEEGGVEPEDTYGLMVGFGSDANQAASIALDA